MRRKKNQKRMRRKMRKKMRKKIRKMRRKTKRKMRKKMKRKMIKRMIKRRKRRNREYFISIKCSSLFSPDQYMYKPFFFFFFRKQVWIMDPATDLYYHWLTIVAIPVFYNLMMLITR